MNTKREIEQYLQTAPKPETPDGLLERLREDATPTDTDKRDSVIRRWFAPTGRSISLWRVAAAAAIAIVIMLPLSYGAVKVIKNYFVVEEGTQHTFDYGDHTYAIGTVTTVTGGNYANKDEARKAYEEAVNLVKEGKAEEIAPGIYKVVLSDGTSMGLNQPQSPQSREEAKKQFDEIEELRKAGHFEKTYMPKHDYEIDGVKHRFFQARYTLSNGKVVTVGSSEPAQDEGKN